MRKLLLPLLTAALALGLGAALLALPGAAHAAAPATPPEQVGARTATATATAGASASQAPTLTRTAPRPLPGQTATPTPAAEAGAAVTLTLPTPTPAAALTQTIALTVPAAAQAVAAPADVGPVQGTILANRTDALVRFFVEGATSDLEPQRARGLTLERPTAVLNLFNCDATLGETQEGCFWDPYLLNRDGFYEIVAGRDAGALVSLVLREAGAPPAGQISIQNRSGRTEEVYFGTQMYEVAGGTIQDFAVEEGVEPVFYLRTCITGAGAGEAPVCEWTAHTAASGGYYALVADEWAGSVAGTTVTSLALEPVLGSATTLTTTVGGETTTVANTPAPQMVCRLAVPALNVRSGPGLEFEIVEKVRSTDAAVATITVVARTEDGQWLKVDERIATGGWVIAGDEYLACDGDANALPAVAAAELPATPTPLPVAAVPVDTTAAAPADASTAGEAAASDAVTETAPAAVPAIPAGQALLVVNNGFEMPIRFTLDQRFRVGIGSSEFDLAPGASVAVVVYPGALAFSASSAWQALSGNANLTIDPDSQRDLWITFIPDPGEPGNWILVY